MVSEFFLAPRWTALHHRTPMIRTPENLESEKAIRSMNGKVTVNHLRSTHSSNLPPWKFCGDLKMFCAAGFHVQDLRFFGRAHHLILSRVVRPLLDLYSTHNSLGLMAVVVRQYCSLLSTSKSSTLVFFMLCPSTKSRRSINRLGLIPKPKWHQIFWKNIWKKRKTRMFSNQHHRQQHALPVHEDIVLLFCMAK